MSCLSPLHKGMGFYRTNLIITKMLHFAINILFFEKNKDFAEFFFLSKPFFPIAIYYYFLAISFSNFSDSAFLHSSHKIIEILLDLLSKFIIYTLSDNLLQMLHLILALILLISIVFTFFFF